MIHPSFAWVRNSNGFVLSFKVRTKETEERVKILARENERMQKKVELLQEELGVLRSSLQ